LVVALNALAIDPGRLWKGPWRWFGEELLACCVPLDQVRQRGLNLDELTCLARCNGADVEVSRADEHGLEAFRAALVSAASGHSVLIAAYDRALLGQTGNGHFSPVGGFSRKHDLALVLDVARFKYPPHWLSAERLWQAMQSIDPATGKARGWMMLRASAHGMGLGYSVSCVGDTWQGIVARLTNILGELPRLANVSGLALAVAPLAAHLEFRPPTTTAHEESLAKARAALRAVNAYGEVLATVGPERADAVTLLLLAVADHLEPEQRTLVGTSIADSALAAELGNVRAQLAALRAHAA
jgi:glutathione gamma-glutamylcysteinyltransferase